MYSEQEWDGLMATLLVECRELHQALEAGLLELERRPQDAEALNGIFRAVHTIKGSAGLFDLERMVRFAHGMESVLVVLRDGGLVPQPELLALLLAASDALGLMIHRIIGEQAVLTPEEEIQAENIERWLGEQLGRNPLVLPQPPSAAVEREEPAKMDCWHISLRFGSETFRHGFDPLAILAYLQTLGRLVNVNCLTEHIPALTALDPESCHWSFELGLHTDVPRSRLVEAVEFVRDDCKVVILPPDSQLPAYVEFIRSMPDEEWRLGEILVASGVITEEELQQALREQQSNSEDYRPLGELVQQQTGVAPGLVDAALNKQTQAREALVRDGKSVRVQADKLDRLIDLVGELVIAGANAAVVAERSGNTDMLEAAARIAELVEAIRDDALRLRMVEIGEVFNRFPRIVRDVSRELGKDIELVISGGETELDKTMVEKIGDPLTHLIRNAIDHGIEAVPARLDQQKPARGTVRLDARHEGGAIVIDVSDDGGGLRTADILDKARSRGLVPANAVMSEAEIHQLIFEPGFSTAAQVTNLSGRGVGMDVVKRSIEALRGSVEIISRQGAGCTFRIRLPLTLAIIDGFLVAVGQAQFVIPLDQVRECLELPAGWQRSGYLDLRQETLPLIDLHELFAIEGQSRRHSVVVVQAGNNKAGLVVDSLLGEQQTVIKPLGRLFRSLDVISGSTILGSGDVALILDVAALVNTAARLEGAAVI